MWLINTKTLELCYFNNDDGVEYAILSHRWEEDEVSLHDLRHGGAAGKKGYAKIKQSCAIALQADIPYVWVDTCCIDKTSSAELSEAINSMYKWYEQAKICYAYLSDVENTDGLAGSRWFTRGWTLQELIAPQTVKFFNRNWKSFGSKAGLQERIASITGIPTRVLRGTKPTECSVAQRMSWAAHRVTTRSEDKAYCLMGLFEVNMPLLYGEGTRAFARLQEEIIKALDDQSIFAWTGHASEYSPVLAPSPANFRHGAEIRSTSAISNPTPFSLTNVGLHIELPMMPFAMNTYLAVLQCQDMTIYKELMPHARFNSSTTRIGILVKRTPQDRQYVRYVTPSHSGVYQIDMRDYDDRLKVVPILLLQQIRKVGELSDMYGFHFRTMTSEVFGYRTGWISPFDLEGEPLDTFQSPGGTYRVLCKLPKTRVKKLETRYHSRITEKNGDTQVLRDVHGLDLDLRLGERGAVATFTLQDKHTRICSSCIAFLKVGFDFDFNPVSLFYGMSSQEWHLYCQSDMTYWADDRNLDEELTRYVNLDQSYCWETHGICALRGSRKSGIDVVLTHLNIHLVIAEELQNGTKKWIVDISPLNLPFEPYLDTAWDDWKGATWHLYCAERARHRLQAELQEATESQRRFNSRTSNAELESALQALEDIEKRILLCQQRLHDIQEFKTRGLIEATSATIARIAREAKESRKERLARGARGATRPGHDWKKEEVVEDTSVGEASEDTSEGEISEDTCEWEASRDTSELATNGDTSEEEPSENASEDMSEKEAREAIVARIAREVRKVREARRARRAERRNRREDDEAGARETSEANELTSDSGTVQTLDPKAQN